MSGFLTIFRKEVIDNLRDRRTLTTMAVSIVVGPMLLFAFLWFAEKSIKEETDTVSAAAIELPVVGAELAPNLMNYLRQKNIAILPAPDDPEQSISSGQHKMVLEITEQFTAAFTQGESAPLRLIHDSSISGLGRVGFETVRSTLLQYSGLVGSLRLQARGISPQIVQAISVNVSDVASPEARNAEILMMLPYLIVIFIMVGGMYLAIDATAGERENGSLESLLCQPVSRRAILLAKLAATILFSALTLLFVLIGLALSFRYVPIESLTISMSAAKVITVFLWCLPFVCVAGALLVLVASFTKSYKEAQSYLGMVMLVPSMPLIVLGLLSPQPSIDNMWVPSLSQGLIIVETMKGESIAMPLLALSAITSLLFAAVLSYVSIKLYERERILG